MALREHDDCKYKGFLLCFILKEPWCSSFALLIYVPESGTGGWEYVWAGRGSERRGEWSNMEDHIILTGKKVILRAAERQDQGRESDKGLSIRGVRRASGTWPLLPAGSGRQLSPGHCRPGKTRGRSWDDTALGHR